MNATSCARRWLVAVGLMLSVGWAGLYLRMAEEPVEFAARGGDLSESPCCCGSPRGECCGTACCGLPNPRDERGGHDPTTFEDRGSLEGIGASGLLKVRAAAAAQARDVANAANPLSDSSLVAVCVRFNC